jgi:hypothetical protein
VKAVSFTTPDAPEKVLAFYQKGLAKYGPVIECVNNQPVGTPARTPEGLTCDQEHNNHVHISDDSATKKELKAGSKQHEHIVEVEAKGTGTKFGLVMLDLPGKLSCRMSPTARGTDAPCRVIRSGRSGASKASRWSAQAFDFDRRDVLAKPRTARSA